MNTSQSISSHYNGRGTPRVTQSSSSTAENTGTLRYKGDSPIRKGTSSPCKINHSVTSILANSQDYTCAAADSTSSRNPLKTSLAKSKNVFAKFADVLTDHFITKGARKGDRPTETLGPAITSNETATQQIVHGIPLTRLSLNPLPLPIQDVANTKSTPLIGDDEVDKEKVKLILGRAKPSSSTTRKRLTIVDEVDFQNGQPLEDPFCESSSGQHTTEFEARLISRQGTRGDPNSTDPFQADHILESCVDAMLTTPPIGCSTPRRRPLSSSRCETATQRSHEPDRVADLIAWSPGVPSVEPKRRCKIPTPRGALRKENQAVSNGCTRDCASKSNPRSENLSTSDSTRLSSYPPGSTIRHVPRSMGRLTDAPTVPVSNGGRAKALPLGKKKHPSPSKGQLELFGKYMEKNLAMGMFKDADELGMSFNSPQAGARTLSPRDTNQLMRNTAVSNKIFQKGYEAHGRHTTLPGSRSRIPQPVRRLSRSRTDTAFARDFMPANKGDSTMEDELQWDTSAYTIGHRCNHCGSTNQIV